MIFLRKLHNPRIQSGFAVLGFVAAVFYITRIISPGGFWGNYVLPAVLWGLLALVIYFFFPAARPANRVSRRRLFYWLALVCGLAGVAAALLGGLLGGFGRSPYDHSLVGILINIFYLGFMLVGMEFGRAYLVNGLFYKQPGRGIAAATLIFTFFSFSLRRLVGFEGYLEGAEFFGSTFLPALLEHGLASYLVLLAGPLPAIIYRGTLLAFHWFSPVLPDPGWTTKALFGTFAPVFGMVLVYTVNRTEVLKFRRREKESIGGWVAASAVSVVMIWFAVGVFSYFPNVIISGSMSPHINVGDIVIVQRIHPQEAAEKVQVGDVIQFREETVRVTHRVIEIKEDDRGLPLFVTQGDANPNPDSDSVEAERFVGKVVEVLPKAGWITIWMRSPG